MHGGGGTTRAVNDQQWKNQIQLYAPREGFYLAPRAPTDTWNLWHQGHIDALFDRLIEDFVIAHGVDPNRVYLMGYSAGGDGVYQLAPRMADRFAAAAMMAGHPNNASPAGLRNLPFMIFVGGNDAGYKRNKVAAEWGEKLARLRDDDPDGYVHKVTIYPGLGHWMERRDAEALPWMAAHERQAWPKRVVWKQSSRTHDRFYWLGLPGNKVKKGQELRAEIKGQVIELYRTGVSTLHLRLNDALIDLDQPITVHADGRTVFEGKLERRVSAIWKSLNARLDPSSVATAGLEIVSSDP
jgi:pimeloyl-ACP methyl ester carboxylesterase